MQGALPDRMKDERVQLDKQREDERVYLDKQRKDERVYLDKQREDKCHARREVPRVECTVCAHRASSCDCEHDDVQLVPPCAYMLHALLTG